MGLSRAYAARDQAGNGEPSCAAKPGDLLAAFACGAVLLGRLAIGLLADAISTRLSFFVIGISAGPRELRRLPQAGRHRRRTRRGRFSAYDRIFKGAYLIGIETAAFPEFAKKPSTNNMVGKGRESIENRSLAKNDTVAWIGSDDPAC